LLVVVATTAVLVLSSTTAFAAGDATLDHLIVKNPVPGWAPLASEVLDQVVALEVRTLSSITNKTVQVGAEGWHEGANTFLVIIANLRDAIPSADREARQAVISACTTASNNPPKSVGSYAPIPGASEAACVGQSASGSAITATAMAWTDKNLFTIMIGSGLSRQQVEAIAERQNGVIPRNGLNESDGGTSAPPPAAGLQSHSRGSNTGLVVAIAGGSGALVVFATILLVSRSRRATPPPALVPGWQPVDGDPSQFAYWDGNGWTARRHWNGTEWIESQPGAS